MYTKTIYYISSNTDHNRVFLEFIPEYEKGEDEKYLLKILPEMIELTNNCFRIGEKEIIIGEDKRISRLIKYKQFIKKKKKLKLDPNSRKPIYIIEYTPLPDMIGKIINGEVIIKQGEMDKYGITLLNDHIALPNTPQILIYE